MTRKKTPTDQAPSESPTGAPAATTDDAEVVALVASFDTANDDEAPPLAAAAPAPLATVDELLAIERRAIDGRWVKWPRLADAEFLLCDYVSHVQEEFRLERIAHQEMAARAKKAGNDYDPKTPLPIDLKLAIQARSRFNRSIKGWRGESLAGRPFDFERFSELWRASIDFRAFYNTKTFELRAEIEQESAELGKA
jgi:hypothetical protein